MAYLLPMLSANELLQGREREAETQQPVVLGVDAAGWHQPSRELCSTALPVEFMEEALLHLNVCMHTCAHRGAGWVM